MKDLLAKLLGMFHQPEATKPVDIPVVAEKQCCGNCNKPAKKTAKKATTRKPKESRLLKEVKQTQKGLKKVK